MSEAVLILGATSAIARGTAAAFAARGDALYLASRDEEELRRIAADLRLRYGVEVQYGLFDAEATDTHEAFFKIGRYGHAESFRRGAGLRLSGRPAGGARFQRGCENHRQQLHRRGFHPELLRELFRAVEARFHHRHFLGGGRPRQAEQLCVWRRQRRAQPVSAGAAQSPVSQRRARHHHQARFRGYRHDLRIARPVSGGFAATHRRAHRGARWANRRMWFTCRGSGATSC